MKKILASVILSMFCSSYIHAQNNPFPQNKTYSYGLMPSNKNASDASSAYSTWKTNFLAPCNNGRFRVKFDNAAQTVSEGIGYGMLLSAYAGDKSVFDGLWLYYKDFKNSHGVMHWKIDGCTGVSGSNGATDSEVDAAMALIVANSQWASSGTINYNADAKALIGAIKNFEVESGSLVLKPGDMFGGSNLTNPSYFAPGYFRAFGQFTNDASFWNGVSAKTYQVINANLSAHNAAGGLVSDWTRADGSYSSDAGGYVNGGTKYTYDAARTPWRIAVDYVWYGSAEAKTYSQKSSDFVRVNLGGSRNIKDGYNQDGSASGQWHNSTFVGAFAAAAMGGGNQSHLDDSYGDLKGINDASSYFNQTLKTLYLYLLTGNFYLPGGATTTPPNPTNISPTVSLSSPANNATFTAPATVTISANASDADGSISKVEFYNGTTKIGEDLSGPYTYSWTNAGAGSYTLTAKATDNAGAVTTSSSTNIIVSTSSTPPASLSPYSGTPTTIPGRIEAEKYDLGGSGVAYSDADATNSGAQFRTDGVDIEATIDAGSGYNIGWTSAGEWLKYSVNVSVAGSYDLKVRIASGVSGKLFHVEINGTNISGSISVPNTGGWQTWQTITIPGLNLSQGNQSMRVYFDTDGINLNYIEFGTAVSSAPSTPANVAPLVSITSPANNSSFTSSSAIQVNANASDNDGSVAKVEFFQGSIKLGEDLSSPYSYIISGLTAGTYSLSVKATDNSGAVTTSAAVSIAVNASTPTPTPTPTGCAIQALPPASQFIVRNSWSDNANGSGVSDATSGLKITHRAWGNSTLWVIQSGKQTSITSGKEYSISFDFLNDVVNPVNSINVGFASNYDGSGPVLAQSSVAVASGYSSSSFTNKTVKITASSTGNIYLSFNLNWPGQPNAITNTFIKNISICEASPAPSQLRIAAVDNLSVFPNPFTDQATLYVASDLNVAMVVEISDMFGNVRVTIPSYTNQNVAIGNQLASGSYVVKATFAGMVLTKSIIKN